MFSISNSNTLYNIKTKIIIVSASRKQVVFKRQGDLQIKFDHETYVTKWVDYSSKYGLGYLLSDGTTGLIFKDMSRITLSPSGR